MTNDSFIPRRLIDLMAERLEPHGYRFLRWGERGLPEMDGVIYEFIWATPDGKKEASTGLSRYEAHHSNHSLNTIAGVLARRIEKKVKEHQEYEE